MLNTCQQGFSSARDLHVADWDLSSWVLAGTWCDVPVFYAPQVAAQPAGQIWHPVELGEVEGFHSRMICLTAVKEKEEEGPRYGQVHLPELCQGQTPTLTGKERERLSTKGLEPYKLCFKVLQALTSVCLVTS